MGFSERRGIWQFPALMIVVMWCVHGVSSMSGARFDSLGDGLRLAYREDGSGDDMARCGFFWLGGFMSDMTGSKAESLAGLARDSRRPSLRFDYSGHGESGGEFTDGTISAWLDQSLHMFRNHTAGRRIVIGSSMGGWIALLLYRWLLTHDPRAARRIAGLVLIAPAADMTADLMWDSFGPSARADLAEKGVWLQPSQYGDPYPITAGLIADGRRHLLLKQGLDCDCPVRILQGDADPDVPLTHALKVYEALRGPDITLTVIKAGDHRLSTPGQLRIIRETVMALAQRSDGVSL
jgi:pimeloyl-ACP methyl ester carboxylesterase